MTIMTNCNCECFCQEVEYEGECLCCVCNDDNDDNNNIIEHHPTLQQLIFRREHSLQMRQYYGNQYRAIDEQDDDAEWKKQYASSQVRFWENEVVQATIALENYS